MFRVLFEIVGKVSVLLLIVGLVAGFFAGVSWGSQTQFELTEKYNQLQQAYEQLKTLYADLNQTYWSLKKAELLKVAFLDDKEYYWEVSRIISNANKSVHVVMYVVKFDPNEPDDPVNLLLQKIVEAKNRGVEVKVLVDDPTLKSYPQTIDFLSENNVPVKLDPKKDVTTHVKMVLVDGKYLFVGSHNWTESALSYNHEVTIKIFSSKDIVDEAENYFMKLWVEGRPLS